MKEQIQQNSAQPEMLQRMLEAGVHFGQTKSKSHPKMNPYLFATRQNIQIIDVEKAHEKLKEACAFLKSVAANGGVILFVATKVPGKLLMREAAQEVGMPYVTERWLGGALTNFPVIAKRLEYFVTQEQKRNQGEFEKYTKKEQLRFQRELEALEKKMGGIKTLKKLPSVLLLVDIEEHLTAVREARKMQVPVVAISGTNTDPTLVAYPIPANDRSIQSVKLLLDQLVTAIKEGETQAMNQESLRQNKNGTGQAGMEDQG